MGSDQIIVNADAPRARAPVGHAGRLLLAAIIAVCGVLFMLLAFVWLNTDRVERRVFLIALFAVAVLALLTVVYWFWIKARHAGIVRLPNGHPLTLDQVAGQPYQFAAQSLAQHYGVLEAEAQRPHPNLTSLNYSYQPQTTTTSAPAALSAPSGEEALAAVPVDEWLPWIDQVPHIILAAQTGDKSTGQGGKSTTAKAILAPRIDRGEHVFVIDPHASGWFDLPAVAGGQNWLEAQQAIEAVAEEYFDRMRQRHEHLQQTGQELPHNHFPRLTVLMDEANETRKYLDIVARRGTATPWQYFTEVLGSGARKVGISVVLLAQSTNVDDLGLTGPMRNNFTRIGLDQRTIKQLIDQEEKDPARRRLLYEALVNRMFPAATVRGSQVHLLDRTGLDNRPQPKSATNSIWPVWTQRQLTATAQPPTPPASQLPPTIPISAPPTVAERIIDLLTSQPYLRLKEIYTALGEDKKTVQNELTAMVDDGRLKRRGGVSRFEYYVP